jgi:hypothetical protein
MTTPDVYFYLAAEKESAFFSLSTNCIPRVGDVLEFDHHFAIQSDREKWDPEAVKSWEQIDQKEFRVVSVQHRFIFTVHGHHKQKVTVFVEPTNSV